MIKMPAARIFYFDDDRSALLVKAVAPAVADIQETNPNAQIALRASWRQGPHVDLFADVPEEQFSEQYWPIIERHVSAWLAENPSSKTLDEDEYLALSKNLAIHELEARPLTPIHSNNTIIQDWHEPDIRIFAVPELAQSQYVYNAISLPVVIDTLRLKMVDFDLFYQRLIELMALTGTFVPAHGLPRSFMSYRAHVEYFFTNYDKTGVAKVKFDQIYDKFEPEIRTAIGNAQAVFEGRADIRDTFGALADWYVAARKLSQDVAKIAEDNAELIGQPRRLSGLVDTLVEDLSLTLDARNERKESEVEVAIGNIDELFKQPSHIAFRSMVNYFYGLLPIMSVPPMTKFGLCHLVARGCEDYFGKDWREVVQRRN